MKVHPQSGRWARALALSGLALVLTYPAPAQRGGGHGGMGGGPGFGGGPPLGNGGWGHPGGFPHGPEGRLGGGPPPGGLQLGPPGRWWDDKHFAKNLQLRPEQQRRMDEAFEANRSVLLRRFQDLLGEQSRMESLVHAKNLDEGALFAQIDRVSQARAELEKANTHLLLQLRGEMDSDQLTRLEQSR